MNGKRFRVSQLMNAEKKGIRERDKNRETTTESREQTGERAREASFATMQIKKREEESMIADNKAQIET